MPSTKPSICHPDLVRHTASGMCVKCYQAANRLTPAQRNYHSEYYRKHKHTKFAEYSKRRTERRRGTDRTAEYRKGKLSLYNLTPEQYEQLLAAQGMVCKICELTEAGKRLSVDHDHSCCPSQRSCGLFMYGIGSLLWFVTGFPSTWGWWL